MRKYLLACLLLSSCGKGEAGSKPGGGRRARPKPKVTVQVVQERPVEYTIEAVGTIEAREEISIPARVSGPATVLRGFREGARVAPDTVLVTIDLRRYELAVKRAEAERDRARAQKDLAQKLYDNRKKLQAEGKRQNKQWVTEEQMAQWEADLKKAEADLKRAEADLELARRNESDASVRPPIRGVLQSKLVSEGQWLKPETVVATMLDVSQMYVRFSVPELEFSRLRRDQEVRFQVRSEPGRWFKAKLFHLGEKVDEKTRAVECKAVIEEKSGAFRSGFYCSVRIVTARPVSRVVPERSVMPTERGFVVYVLEKGKVHPRIVRLGLRTNGGVEILQGVKKGETIVVDGAAGLRPGAVVQVVEGKK